MRVSNPSLSQQQPLRVVPKPAPALSEAQLAILAVHVAAELKHRAVLVNASQVRVHGARVGLLPAPQQMNQVVRMVKLECEAFWAGDPCTVATGHTPDCLCPSVDADPDGSKLYQLISSLPQGDQHPAASERVGLQLNAWDHTKLWFRKLSKRIGDELFLLRNAKQFDSDPDLYAMKAAEERIDPLTPKQKLTLLIASVLFVVAATAWTLR